MADDRMNTRTLQTDGRRVFTGYWPINCEAQDCEAQPDVRVRLPGRTAFVCFADASREPYASAPAKDRDVL